MDLKNVTATIQQLMEERDVSQRSLAARLGLSPTTLNKMLRGSGNLQMDTLIAIAEALDVEPMVLLAPSEEWRTVYEAYASLSPSRRQTARIVLLDMAALEEVKHQSSHRP